MTAHGVKVVVGRAPPIGDPAARAEVARSIALLALRVRDVCCEAGLTLRVLERTHQLSSPSAYLHLVDARGRDWRIRVSNHHRPRRSARRHPPVDLDLVAFDGRSGLAEVRRWIASAVQASCSAPSRGAR